MLLTCTKLPLVVKTFVSSIYKWPLKTGFTVYLMCLRPLFHFIVLMRLSPLMRSRKLKNKCVQRVAADLHP